MAKFLFLPINSLLFLYFVKLIFLREEIFFIFRFSDLHSWLYLTSVWRGINNISLMCFHDNVWWAQFKLFKRLPKKLTFLVKAEGLVCIEKILGWMIWCEWSSHKIGCILAFVSANLKATTTIPSEKKW